jgi:ABC-type transport system involved in multi-copper enzyme maturation permease subunit
MSDPDEPYRSTQSPNGGGFANLLRAELTKLLTVKGWIAALLLSALLVIGFAWVSAAGNGFRACSTDASGKQTCVTKQPAPVTGPDGEPVVDSYTFVHQPLSGDGSVTTHVSSLTETTTPSSSSSRTGGQATTGKTDSVPWAKAGIILTSSATEGSPYAAIMLTAGNGVRFQSNYTHDVPGAPALRGNTNPQWLRLTRSGDVITGYESVNGRTWARVGAATLTGLSRTAQEGLFVTSPTADTGGSEIVGTTATATFNQATVTGATSGNWVGTVIGGNTPNYPIELPTGLVWTNKGNGSFTVQGSGDIAPQVAGGLLSGIGFFNSLQAGGAIGLLPLVVVAALFISSELQRGLIQTTFAASPHRGRVVTAKVIVLGGVAFIIGCLGSALASIIARQELVNGGNYVFPVTSTDEAQIIAGSGLLFALVAVLTLALATIFRRAAEAIVLGVVLLVLPFILQTTLSPTVATWIFRLTPSAGFAVDGTLPQYAQVANSYTLLNGYYPLPAALGLAVLAGYVALALTAAVLLVRRRDV